MKMNELPLSNLTLRLDIFREASAQYKEWQTSKHATPQERMLYALKEMECETMIKELDFKVTKIPTEQLQWVDCGGKEASGNDKARFG